LAEKLETLLSGPRAIGEDLSKTQVKLKVLPSKVNGSLLKCGGEIQNELTRKWEKREVDHMKNAFSQTAMELNRLSWEAQSALPRLEESLFRAPKFCSDFSFLRTLTDAVESKILSEWPEIFDRFLGKRAYLLSPRCPDGHDHGPTITSFSR
jgi:hypothetical protein